MADFYGWIGGALAVIVGFVVAWFTGRSKGKNEAQSKALEEKTRNDIAASQAAAKRETSVSREAAHVDQKVNNASDADVDKQLLDKWTRK